MAYIKRFGSRSRRPNGMGDLALGASASVDQQEGLPAYATFTMSVPTTMPGAPMIGLTVDRVEAQRVHDWLSHRLAEVHDGRGGVMIKPQDGG